MVAVCAGDILQAYQRAKILRVNTLARLGEVGVDIRGVHNKVVAILQSLHLATQQVRLNQGLDVEVVVGIAIAGRLGAEAEQNSVFGFIKFGSRIDILLPKDAKLLVEIGDKVVGTQTPIARIGGIEEVSLETPEEESLETESGKTKN